MHIDFGKALYSLKRIYIRSKMSKPSKLINSVVGSEGKETTVKMTKGDIIDELSLFTLRYGNVEPLTNLPYPTYTKWVFGIYHLKLVDSGVESETLYIQHSSDKRFKMAQFHRKHLLEDVLIRVNSLKGKYHDHDKDHQFHLDETKAHEQELRDTDNFRYKHEVEAMEEVERKFLPQDEYLDEIYQDTPKLNKQYPKKCLFDGKSRGEIWEDIQERILNQYGEWKEDVAITLSKVSAIALHINITSKVFRWLVIARIFDVLGINDYQAVGYYTYALTVDETQTHITVWLNYLDEQIVK